MIHKYDLLGKTIKVVDSKNASLIGIGGVVVSETKNTLRVKTVSGVKVLLKDQVVIEFDGVLLDCSLITQRPEDRVKTKVQKWQRKKPQVKATWSR